jgi:hypothetical protein
MRKIPATNRPASPFGTFLRVIAALRARRHLFSARSGPKALGVGLLGVVTIVAVTGTPAFPVTPLNLGTATPYAVIAGSTITNTGNTVITGRHGSHRARRSPAFLPALRRARSTPMTRCHSMLKIRQRRPISSHRGLQSSRQRHATDALNAEQLAVASFRHG